jgi:regulatory protein
MEFIPPMPHSFSPDDLFGPILQKTEHFCAYQERCSHEVEQKLREWKVPESKTGTIMKHLEENGFLDDARFARTFAISKFHLNKWGRVKIRFELKSRSIPENMISTAFEDITEEDYLKTIRELILKKKEEIKNGKNLMIREKIIKFVAGKGFEFDLIAGILKELKI